jgi:hypothetical protein
MRSLALGLIAVVVLMLSGAIQAQTGATDVYHVMFVKALPGQAAAVAKQLQQQDPKDPMAGHFLLLRHQEGDDWDYCVIQHLGKQTTVAVTPPPPAADTPTRAWHNDSFVSGPSWAEFSKLMTGSPTSVYVVGVHRAAPGRRVPLLELLNRRDPAVKVPISHTTMEHLEGGPWQILTLDRYNSWQDLAAARAAAAAGEQGWFEVRQNSAAHWDTIADRVGAK